MKQFSFFLLTFFLCLFSFSQSAFAADDGDDGDVIDITYLDPGESNNRSQAGIPIIATYYSDISSVVVSFVGDIGVVNISLTNITTGDTCSLCVLSNMGNIIVPVSFGNGYYYLEFHTSDGATYYGIFAF